MLLPLKHSDHTLGEVIACGAFSSPLGVISGIQLEFLILPFLLHFTTEDFLLNALQSFIGGPHSLLLVIN